MFSCCKNKTTQLRPAVKSVPAIDSRDGDKKNGIVLPEKFENGVKELIKEYGGPFKVFETSEPKTEDIIEILPFLMDTENKKKCKGKILQAFLELTKSLLVDKQRAELVVKTLHEMSGYQQELMENYRADAQSSSHTTGFLQHKVTLLQEKNAQLETTIEALQTKLEHTPFKFDGYRKGNGIYIPSDKAKDKFMKIATLNYDLPLHIIRTEKNLFLDNSCDMKCIKSFGSRNSDSLITQTASSQELSSKSNYGSTKQDSYSERYPVTKDFIRNEEENVENMFDLGSKSHKPQHKDRNLEAYNTPLLYRQDPEQTKQHMSFRDSVNMSTANNSAGILAEVGQAPLGFNSVEDFNRFTQWILDIFNWSLNTDATEAQLISIIFEGLGSTKSKIEGFTHNMPQLLTSIQQQIFNIRDERKLLKSFVLLPNESITSAANRIIKYLASLQDNAFNANARESRYMQLRDRDDMKRIILQMVHPKVYNYMELYNINENPFNMWIVKLQMEADRWSNVKPVYMDTEQSNEMWRGNRNSKYINRDINRKENRQNTWNKNSQDRNSDFNSLQAEGAIGTRRDSGGEIVWTNSKYTDDTPLSEAKVKYIMYRDQKHTKGLRFKEEISPNIDMGKTYRDLSETVNHLKRELGNVHTPVGSTTGKTSKSVWNPQN